MTALGVFFQTLAMILMAGGKTFDYISSVFFWAGYACSICSICLQRVGRYMVLFSELLNRLI